MITKSKKVQKWNFVCPDLAHLERNTLSTILYPSDPLVSKPINDKFTIFWCSTAILEQNKIQIGLMQPYFGTHFLKLYFFWHKVKKFQKFADVNLKDSFSAESKDVKVTKLYESDSMAASFSTLEFL